MQAAALEATRAYYVSYAWGDETAEGRLREAKVDELCRQAVLRGRTIQRDKDTLRAGDRISEFMQRLGEGDRIFAFLSDKYLKSAHCMFELSEVWRNCRQRDTEFKEKTRVYILPCARIDTVVDRASYAAFWQDEYERVEVIIRERGWETIGVRGLLVHQHSKSYSQQISDLLTLISDVVRPPTFAEFVRHGFGTGHAHGD